VFGDKHAAEFIWERCSQHPGEITLVTIGPLSNVALCLRNHPGAAAPSLSRSGTPAPLRTDSSPCAGIAALPGARAGAREGARGANPNLNPARSSRTKPRSQTS